MCAESDMLSVSFKPLTVYLDDLEFVYTTISEVCPTVDVRVDDQPVRNLQHLRTLGQRYAETVSMDGYVARELVLQVHVGPDDARLCGSPERPAYREAFSALQARLESCRRPLGRIPLRSAVVLAGVMFVLAGAFVVVLQLSPDMIVVLGGVMVIAAILYWQYVLFDSAHALIILRYPTDAYVTLDRDYDALGVAVASGTFGALTGILMLSFI